MSGLTLQPKKVAPRPFVFRTPTPPPPEKKQADSRSEVICGMTIVHPDATIDPGIVKSVPDTKTTFTLKTVQPSVCAAR